MKDSKAIIKKLLDNLKDDERVEAVFRSGSLERQTKYSDIDLIVVMYEESGLNSIVNNVLNIFDSCSEVLYSFKCTAHHFFIVLQNMVIFDINFITSAFLWGNKFSVEVFNKSGFELNNNNTKSKPNSINDMLSDIFFKYINGMARTLSKIEKEEFWLVPRFLNSLRNSSILPLISLFYKDSITNIIKINPSNIDKNLYSNLINTFTKPIKKEALIGVTSAYKILEIIIIHSNNQYLKNLQKKSKELSNIKKQIVKLCKNNNMKSGFE